jgi:hypothetical protein
MAHAQAMGPRGYDFVSRTSYIIIVVALLALLVLLVVSRGISTTIDHSGTPKSETTNSANEGGTGATGAPTTDTNTPTDRTVPSTSGGNANTLLNPNGTP